MWLFQCVVTTSFCYRGLPPDKGEIPLLLGFVHRIRIPALVDLSWLYILCSKQRFIGGIMLLIIQYMCQLNAWDVQNRPSDFGRFLTMFRRLPDVLTIMTTLELLQSYINRGYYVATRRYEISHECWKIFHDWAPRTSEMFFQHEKKKFRISKRPCNVLFII